MTWKIFDNYILNNLVIIRSGAFFGLIPLTLVALVNPAAAVETASVLPKGIFRARLVTVVTDTIKDKYNDKGLLEPIPASLNRTVTNKNFAQQDPQFKKLVDTLNAVSPKLGDQVLNANLFSSFELRQRVLMPAFEYGINDRLSIGIRIPVITRQLTSEFSATGTNNGSDLKALNGDFSPQLLAGLSKVEQLRLGTAFFEQKLFISKGYDVPNGYSKTDMGDVELGTKWNFLKTGPWMATLLSGFKLPTGKPASLTNVYDAGTSKEAYAVGLKFIEEYAINDTWLLATSQNLEYYLPDSRRRAVPKDAQDSLPSLLLADGQVHEVRRVQAQLIELEAGVEGRFLDKSIVTWGGFGYSTQGHSSYSGEADLYYDGLAENTDSHSVTSEVGLTYSSIPAFKKGLTAIPYEIQGRFNTTLDGSNTPLTNYFRLDTIVYF